MRPSARTLAALRRHTGFVQSGFVFLLADEFSTPSPVVVTLSRSRRTEDARAEVYSRFAHYGGEQGPYRLRSERKELNK